MAPSLVWIRGMAGVAEVDQASILSASLSVDRFADRLLSMLVGALGVRGLARPFRELFVPRFAKMFVGRRCCYG
ncbi:hypothetical protein CSW25_07990 [Thermus scotoductus]|uniref:Uncharacterized protein n=1 Tax=Thermus scotoductus TaxID=37636 RepID=A0ABY0AHK6_THESC|nr:hypothetical protein CSW46_04445 [Thermus scotoductus]RTH14489.1 hypothetical protein CSW39_14005 [Thermus scotoductus]RTH42417.1 hypothetical protein CSW34_01120 [Thermus scotoductus]RTI06616.1 hypothetical protein CSW25_07990 [Thermus scotoductus]RTI27305.1 hypothetical protein CSW20_01135 [Thermus scotoductus]